MLTQEIIAQLKIDSPTFLFGEKPQFMKQSELWTKQNIPPTLLAQKKVSGRHEFIKIGKTFGMQIKRYAAICGNYLVYYNDASYHTPLAYCNLDNAYVYFLHTSQGKHLLYITNGKYCSKFYFDKKDFLDLMKNYCGNSIIQLNYTQKYETIDFLGQGNFSKVYLARRYHDQKLFASKVVSKLDKNGQPTFNCVFEQKKILKKLTECDYIYKFEEFYEEGDNYVFIIQYLQGTDLMTLLKDTNFILTLQDKISILKRILQALIYCHKSKVIHRDLKPQNIIIDMKTKKPKIIDFGLSMTLSAQNQLSDFKRCGTMGYMAPQVVQNSGVKRKAYDYKCDIFSYGIIAHMILLGVNPLKGKNYEQTFLNNKECNIQLDRALIIEKYDESCYEFLDQILTRNPRQRPSAEKVLNMRFFKNRCDKQCSESTADKMENIFNKKQKPDIIDIRSIKFDDKSE